MYKLKTSKLILYVTFLPVFCMGQIELVTNGTFTTDISGWTTSGNVAYSNFFLNGCAAFSGGNTPVNGIISQNIPASVGTTLTITLNYGRRGTTGAIVAGLFEIINNTTAATISSTTLTAPNTAGFFVSTTFTLVSPSNSLLIRFTDQTSNTIARDFYFNTISITRPFPIPIELVNFTTKAIDNHSVQLSWETASETDNDYFTIERSTDGSNWQILKKINGAGNSSSLVSYVSYDQNPLNGLSYYRLKQTDFNGSFKYSQIRSVVIKTPKKPQVELYPNPVYDIITLKGNGFEVTQYKVYNIFGQDVTAQTIQVESNASKVIIDLSHLGQGLFFIKVKNITIKVHKR